MKHLKISQSDYIENLTAAAVDDVVIAFVEHQIHLGRQGEKRAWVMSEVLDLVRETFGNEACPTVSVIKTFGTYDPVSYGRTWLI